MPDAHITDRVVIIEGKPEGFPRETDYRRAAFKSWCGKLSGHHVGLYGSGANARHILETEGFESDSAIVIDDRAVGKIVCGKTAVSLDQAFAMGIDSLVIAAQYNNARTIFERIRQICLEHSVRMFDMYGNDLQRVEEQIMAAFGKSLAEQMGELDSCDAICISLDALLNSHSGQTIPTSLRMDSSLDSCLTALLPYLSIRGKELVFYSNNPSLGREEAIRALEGMQLPNACTLLLAGEVGLASTNGLFRIVYEQFHDARVAHVCLLDTFGLMDLFMSLVYGKEIVPIGLLPTPLRPSQTESCQANWHQATQERGSSEGRLAACVETLMPSIEDSYGRVLSPTIGIVAQLVVGFTTWLAQNLTQRSGEHDEVLFASRDGHLLKDLYDMLRKMCPQMPLPPSRYFYTSRKASERACSQEGNGPAERLRYLEYISSCGLRAGASYAFVEFVGAGTCQRQLEAFVPFRLCGFYFGSRIGPLLPYSTESACYFDETMQAFLSRYLFLEPYLSSPEPSLEGFSMNGTPIFAEEYRSPEEIRILQSVHAGVLAIAAEYFAHWYGCGDVVPSGYLNALMPSLDRCDTSAMRLINDTTGDVLSKVIEENERLYAKDAAGKGESLVQVADSCPPELHAIHKQLLETLKAFDALCNQHGLAYAVSHGTLLGAMRNKRFIPWDDDVDVVMLREDYDKLVALAGTEAVPERYLLQTPLSSCTEFFGGYSRFIDLSGKGSPPNEPDASDDSIHIDVMPLDNCPLDERAEAKQRNNARRWQNLLYAKTRDHDYRLLFSVNPRRVSAYYILADHMSYRQLYKGLHKTCTACKPTGKLAIFAGNTRRRSSKECFELDDIVNAVRAPFEDCSVPVPKNAERWLENYYGADWRDERKQG